MLTLTENAAEAIRTIIESSEFDETDAGLRFSLQSVGEEEAQLMVALVPEPADGDEDVETEGARVFLDEPASLILADKVLDAFVGDEGEVGFQFADRPGENGAS